ncbi:MAG: serine acetyltransferase, partial [Desulfobacteraceae bacterium]
MEDSAKMEQCKTEMIATRRYREEVPAIVDQLVMTCDREDCFDHISPEPIPSRDAVIDIIEKARRILYPGYFIRSRVDEVNLGYYFGQEATSFFEALSDQLALSIRHECLRYNQPCTHCEERGQQVAIEFMQKMPLLRSMLAKDVRAAYQGDPAADSYDEVIFSYPGLFAITVYRIAHELYEQGIPLMPRIMA